MPLVMQAVAEYCEYGEEDSVSSWTPQVLTVNLLEQSSGEASSGHGKYGWLYMWVLCRTREGKKEEGRKEQDKTSE